MNDSGLQSMFSQKLDRGVFVVYALGAITPLMALVIVAQRFALPALEKESYGVAGLLGMILAIGGLSLMAFFALRRMTHTALEQMDSDNERLTRLLRMSRELSDAPHLDLVSKAAVESALTLVDARAAFLLLCADPGKELELSESAGEGAAEIYAANEGLLRELVEAADAQGGRASLNSAAFGKATSASHPLAGAAAMTVPGDAAKVRGALLVVHSDPGRTFSSGELDSVSTLSSLTAVAMANAHLQDTQRNFFSYVTEILVATLDEQVDGRKGHATAVAQLANRIGRELGLEDDRLQSLHFASLLHDIGMLKIDRRLQRDPNHFRKHATLGHRMLNRIILWSHIAPIVHHHHEFFDGSGYPEGLAGEEIPLESRIIMVADTFDAMRRPDGSRPGRSLQEVRAEFQRGVGGQFDPQVVAAFEALAERGDIDA